MIIQMLAPEVMNNQVIANVVPHEVQGIEEDIDANVDEISMYANKEQSQP